MSIEWRRVVMFTSYLTIGSIIWVVFAYVDSVMIGGRECQDKG